MANGIKHTEGGSVNSTIGNIPNEDLSHHMKCMEVWGGNVEAENGVSVHGIDAWITSQPYMGNTGGGDIHYVSMCGAGRIARFVLADVAGHGEEVSDLAVMLRSLMRKHIGAVDQTRFAVTLNRAFNRLSRDGKFATAVLSTYFAPSDQLITCLAGHPRPLWYQAAKNQWTLLSQDMPNTVPVLAGVPFGIIHPTDYHQFAVTLGKGDLVVLYTDAMTETAGPPSRSIGEDGLLQLAESVDTSDPAGFGRSLIAEVDKEFGLSRSTRTDDLTIMVLHHNAADPPQMSIVHKLQMMAKMMGL